MYYSTVLDSLISDLSHELDRMNQELKDAPTGRLARTVRPDGTYYYHHQPKRGYRKTAKRTGITYNEDMIHQLARKRFVEVEQDTARRNLLTLQQAREQYQIIDPDTARRELGGPYQDLPAHMFTPWIPPELRLLTDPNYHDEYRIHVTPDGTTVRSKSELVIVSRLEHFDVDATYEHILKLDRLHYHPDFTIRRRRDGKTIYWEHAGAMTVPQYRRSHEARLTAFEANGIVPWDNLIITYDDEKGGLDVRIVDALIQGWLL